MNEEVNADIYKKLICEMIWKLDNDRFVRQIYSIILIEIERAGS